jgi:hypothetical protein
MDAASATFLVLILLIVGIFALGIWLGGVAKRQRETVVPVSPQRAAEIVETAFNKLFWADTNGPGMINKRRRTPNGSGATISIVLEPTTNGHTHAVAWMSAWKTRYGLVASGGSMHAKKVIERLEQVRA